MNRELFLAILSMDSYNRGYGRSLKFDPTATANDGNDAGKKIGNATILDIDLPQNSTNYGFYASAYRLGDGSNAETVISYRGSDNFLGQDGLWNAIPPFRACLATRRIVQRRTGLGETGLKPLLQTSVQILRWHDLKRAIEDTISQLAGRAPLAVDAFCTHHDVGPHRKICRCCGSVSPPCFGKNLRHSVQTIFGVAR
jgi:hypothetical protein